MIKNLPIVKVFVGGENPTIKLVSKAYFLLYSAASIGLRV